jgi:hypothetical protein
MLTACKTLSWRWLYQGLTAGMLHWRDHINPFHSLVLDERQ